MEEEGWYLHNAMIHEGVIYHPDCFKDLQKNGDLDNSLDTTADSVMDTSSGVIKEERPEESDQEMKPLVPEVTQEQAEEMITEPAPAESTEMVVETPVSVKEEQPEPESVNTEAMEAMELTEEVKTELTDKLEEPEQEVKEETEKEVKEEKEEAEKEVEEESSANTSLVGDESHMLAAPVMSQPKVVNLLEGGDWLCLPSQFSSIVIITKIYTSPRSSSYQSIWTWLVSLCCPIVLDLMSNFERRRVRYYFYN